MVLHRLQRLHQRFHQLLDGGDQVSPIASIVIITERVLCQRRAQTPEHTVVVDDDPAVLAGIDTVGAGDGLHQGVGLHRLIDVQGREALDVEAGEPHGTHDGDAERVLRILESVVDLDALAVTGLEPRLHHEAMRDDVEAPFLEVAHLVLSFADDDLDDGAPHPLRLTAGALQPPAQPLACVLIRRPELHLQL